MKSCIVTGYYIFRRIKPKNQNKHCVMQKLKKKKLKKKIKKNECRLRTRSFPKIPFKVNESRYKQYGVTSHFFTGQNLLRKNKH